MKKSKKKGRFWRIMTVYLFVGIFWGAFAAQKGLELDLYDKETASTGTVTVITNAFSWPVAIPIAVWGSVVK